MTLSSKTGINPKIWGPYFWETFHFTAFGYPKTPNSDDKENYKSFYESFVKVIPCDKCSISSQELFKNSNISKSLNSRDDLIKWTYTFHKNVNNKLKKDSPTYEEFLNNFKNRNKDSGLSNLYYLLLFLVIFSIAVLFFMRCT